MASASAIIDFFKGDGFRWPIVLGGSYLNLLDDFPDGSSNVQKTPAFLVGTSIQFNVGWFRLSPFVMLSPGGKPVQQSCANCEVRSNPTAGGVNILFLPLNLSTMISFVRTPNSTITAFALDYTFVGGREKR